MAKNKISEWSPTPANNTDVGGIDIAEGCAPSGINNAIREVMAQVKDMQSGTDGDNFTVGGNLNVTGNTTLSNTLTANSSVGTIGQALISRGSGLSPEWGSGFPTGGIIIWSGSAAAIPSGWLLCDGTNLTPDLRNRFVVGAGSTYAVDAIGGSADAIVPSHSHTLTATSQDKYISKITGNTGAGYTNPITINYSEAGSVSANVTTGRDDGGNRGINATGKIDSNPITGTADTTGSSATNANLPPYYALCYIMKA